MFVHRYIQFDTLPPPYLLLILSELIKVADSVSSMKYRFLDPKGMEAESTLEVTPATCSVTLLGPVAVVRLLVLAISSFYQVQVTYPIPRSVDQLKVRIFK